MFRMPTYAGDSRIPLLDLLLHVFYVCHHQPCFVRGSVSVNDKAYCSQ
uniref:Uncharacterized protein n=1 Tax=Anguilla anguilla TaxID=7936 RepID=A0A0E9SAX3_ANGAN